jgi:hypothetical protein
MYVKQTPLFKLPYAMAFLHASRASIQNQRLADRDLIIWRDVMQELMQIGSPEGGL